MQWIIFGVVQVIVLISVYSYFRWRNKKDAAKSAQPCKRESSQEYNELTRMRSRSLSVPLSEKVRPQSLDEIIGQKDGIRALSAALCGKNPQHVLIYGPPGIGKTCAARLILEKAKKNPESPFNALSKFVEVDATCVRFDERAIADPLLGSVHDPIYQGAGALGIQGVPQPKAGAVTKAHCGMLFLDEIGELHPLQMNKLLKVLEDRRVFFESAYYSKSNNAIPTYIHDIFQNGLPADFRLIGATTRSPEEIPPALRSRCIEIFFTPLSDENLRCIAINAAKSVNMSISRAAVTACSAYANSGRSAVAIIQLASGIAHSDQRKMITQHDIEWVANTCHYTKKHTAQVRDDARIGTINGLGVANGVGNIIEIECRVKKAAHDMGALSVRGAIEEEQLEFSGKKLTRKSTIFSSAENAIDAVSRVFNIDCAKYDIVFNIPTGIPLDGPSAGLAFCLALTSTFFCKPPIKSIAVTGEVNLCGEILPVGGIREKAEAAKQAGAKVLIVPAANLSQVNATDISVFPVRNISEAVAIAFDMESNKISHGEITPAFACGNVE